MKAAIIIILCASFIIAITEESNSTLLRHLTGKMGAVVSCCKNAIAAVSASHPSQKLSPKNEILLKSLTAVVINSTNGILCSGAMLSMLTIAIPKVICDEHARKKTMKVVIQDHKLIKRPTIHEVEENVETIGAAMDICIMSLLDPIILDDYENGDSRSEALENSPFAQPEDESGYYGVSVAKNPTNQIWEIALREYQLVMACELIIIVQVKEESQRFFQRYIGDPLYYKNKLVGLYKEDVPGASHFLNYMRTLKQDDNERVTP